MASRPQDRYVLGDEYLPDLRLRGQNTASNTSHHHHRLPQNPRRPSQQARDFHRRTMHTVDEQTFSNKHRVSSHHTKPDTSVTITHKNNSNDHSTSNKANGSSSRPTSSALHQASRPATEKAFQKQLCMIPSGSMFDRWMGQTNRQDSFHALDHAAPHRYRTEKSEKRNGKQRGAQRMSC